MQYRRAHTEGGCYFFTVNLVNHKWKLLAKHIDELRDVMRKVKKNHPFQIDAMVVLPDHLHVLWTLPEGDADYSTRWTLIKSGFSRLMPKDEYKCKSRITKGERGIWQRRYWEHLIKDEEDYNNHINYIHYNPVKHGYVDYAVEWKYSSIHRYIKNGMIDRKWGVKDELFDAKYGERK